MNFSKIDRAIATCKRHLSDTKTQNTEIEAHLAGYLLVFISAEFEMRVSDLMQARADRSNDDHIRNFVKHAAKKLVRGPKISEISGVLKCFHEKCSGVFHNTSDEQSRTAYDSIMNNRHDFVHRAICTVTVGDVEAYFNNSRAVFSAIVAAIGLHAKEVAHLS